MWSITDAGLRAGGNSHILSLMLQVSVFRHAAEYAGIPNF